MPDTGAPYFIPYVEPTDLVRDYPAADEASADAIAAALDAIPVLAGIGSNVVQTVKTDGFSTTSSSFVDVTGVTGTITPSKSDSIILGFLVFRFSNSASSDNVVQMLRDATVINLANSVNGLGNLVSFGAFTFMDTSFVFTDAPASTTAVTYKMQVKRNSGTLRIGERDTGGNVRQTTLTLLEVAA